nr:stress-induced protein YchH [Klebsiella pneumoniae]
MPAFEWVHVQLHQQKGMISLSPPTICNSAPQLNLPQFFAHGAILSIFVGAVLWLAGARIGGHEQVSDRYWWVRHYDKRCRRNQHRHS